MNDKVKKALEARKSRKKKDEESFKEKSKKSQDKVSSALKARESRKKNNLQSTFSDLESNIITEIEALKKLSTPSWGGGNEEYKNSLEATRQNRINVDNLIRKVEANRKYLGDEKADYLLSNLNNMKASYESHVSAAEVRSQYKSEDEYKKKIEESEKAQKDYEALTTFDIEAGKKEIEDLSNGDEITALRTRQAAIKEQISELGNQTKGNGFKKKKQLQEELNEVNAKIREIESQITSKKAYLNKSEYIQGGIKLTNDALNAEDFEENSKYIDNVSYGLGGKPHFEDEVYAYINNPTVEDKRWGGGTTTAREIIGSTADIYGLDNPYDDGESSEEENALDYLNENEVAIYNYYYATEGKEKAEKFLASIQETLNYRKATKDFGALEGHTFAELLFGVEAGLDQFSSGMKNLFNTEDDYIPSSATQMTSGMVREDLADDGFKILGNSIGQIGYDLINTTSNMLPSILTSTAVGFINPVAGQVVGAGLMGASASGNAYAEMLNLGYDKGQARLYSGMVGASEATLQYLLGGIGKLGGGKLTTKAIVGIANNMDNAFARVAIKLGANAVGEFTEEYLQEVLDPFFKNITLGTSEDIKLFSTEALYSGVLGALSAGILEGGSTISSDIKTTQLGERVQKIDGGVERLKKLGTTFSADTVAHQIADKVTEETGAYKIGLLLQEAGATLSEQNVSDITIELSKVMDEGSAKKIAKTYQAFLNGEMSLTDEQVEVLEGLDPLANVMRKSIIGRNTSIYQRTREYNDLVQLATGVESNSSASSAPEVDTESTPQTIAPYSNEYVDSVAKEFEAMGMPTEHARILAEKTLSTPTEGKSSPTEEKAVESKYEVSAEGKTINTKNDEIVSIKNIESISGDGEVNLTLDNGMVVKASDLAFGSAAEAFFVENIGAIKLGKNPISSTSANALYMTAMNALKERPKMTADEAMSLIKGLEESYVYGAYNFGESNLTKSKSVAFARELSQAQIKFAYALGSQDRVSNAKADQKVITDLVEKAKANKDASSKSSAKKGSVRFEEGVVAKGKLQKRTVSLAKHLARIIGIDIVFYDARTTNNSNGKDANGYFDVDTDTIYLDLQNSHDDAKTIAFTLSHELVHFIKKWSPAKFDTFANFLMEQYTAHGVDSSKLLANKMTELGTKDADFAYEEMICDACETMLLDSDAIYKLMELRKTDLELFDKIKLHIHELLNKIRNMYKKLGLNPTSDEAKALLEMKDVLEQIYSLFEEAAVDAVESYQAVSTLETEAVSVSEEGTVMMQMKQYQQTGRATLLKYLKEQYGDADANSLISTIDNIYNTMKDIKKDETLSVFSNWQDSEVELDENGHPIFTTSINNGDYELNQDFSRVCKKRRQLDFVLNMLAEDPAFEASSLTKQDFVKINKAIKEHGFEIACALCFVDSKRFRQAEWADSFANTWNDILYSVVDDTSKLTPFNFATKKPNLTDDGIEIDTSKPVMYRKWSEGKEDVKNRKNYDSFDKMLSKDGKKWIEGNTNVRTIATLIRDNPNLRHTFRGADIIASQGFDTIQRLAPGIRGILDGWGGSSVPKPSSSDASYDSSIINLSGYNKETAYAMGGARMNSFSDFMAHMFFDYCQAFSDLAAKELPSQAYTKELIYVRLFGRSGQKINMSGIAAIRDDALPTTAQKGVSKAEAEVNEKIEKMIAGLDVSRLLEHLNKDIHQLTEADVEQFLDMCDYVWADESINMKHATLLQTGILYDKLSDSKVEECYELLKAGEIEQALKVAGEGNVDTEYAKHCGTIVVGVSDAHIRKLLRDPTVRMVIPYHKSGLNPVIARELRISAYNDYTLTQTTGVKRKGAKSTAKIGSDEIKAAYGLKDFVFYDWFGKTIDGKVYDGKATADKYLEWCEKGYYDEKVGDYVYYTTKGDGYILAKEFHKKATIVPKFEAFIGEENYYKVLEDFDCYNTISGEHSAQGAVDFLRNGLPSDYKSVLMDALKAEQKVHDDFRDHLDNKGLKDEIMDIVKANGYKPSIKKQAKPSKKNPEQLDPRTVTREDVVELLNNVNLGAYDDNTYIPLRISTPAALIYWAKKKLDDVIDNNPIAMSAGKAYQAMAQRRLGDESRPHKLSVPNMISIIEAMNDPQYIVYQGGNGRYVEVLNYNTEDGKKAFAVLEIGDFKDAPYMNGYEDGIYNVLVTTYPPDSGKLQELLKNPKNKVIFDKEKDLSQGTSSSMVPSVLNDKPFYEDIVPQEEKTVKKQLKKSSSSYAPTFYSQMGKAIEAVKQEKLAANSVVNMLRGKGVKAEEIRWSGIVPFLEGKKSVTKQELLDFINGSMLQIGEQISSSENESYRELNRLWEEEVGGTIDEALGGQPLNEDTLADIFDDMDKKGLPVPFIETQLRMIELARNAESNVRWSQYKLDGGTNYRELVFTLPNSTYSNRAMRGHWGQDAEGILVHARIQDFDVNGKKMLFVEELQSDWHNEGHSKGYSTKEYEDAVKSQDKLYNEYKKLDLAYHKYVRSNEFMTDPEDVRNKKHTWLRRKAETAQKKYLDAEKAVNSLKEKGAGDTPDAPFKDNYHEYVMKRLLRMAAEEGYDSIGWTPADIQSKRWSEDYAEAYRIEYDQDMPKFLKKYGRQWGAKVEKTRVGAFEQQIDVDSQTSPNDDAWLLADGISFEGTEVWSMDITDSMKESVLYEGQAMYQKKTASNRSILANALESAAQSDIEKNKLKEYKEKINLINAEEKRLSEIQQQLFTKGGVEPENRKALQFEAKQIANRINTYDRQLLNLESTTSLKNVLNREKELARKRQKQKDAEKMREYKEKVAKTTRELLDRHQESRKKAVEGREKTAMRHKIQNVVSELNQLLLRGTKDKHVMIGLQKAVAEALDAVNMDTVGAEERVAKYNALIAKAKDPDVIASLTATRDRIQEQGGKMSEKLNKLKNAYNDIKNSDDPLIANSHDEVIASRFEYIAEKIGNTPIRDMTLEQLEDVYDMYKMVLTTIRNSNKAFKNAKNESIATLGNRVMMEVEKVGGKKKFRIAGTEGIEKFNWNNLKPVYAMSRIGSDTLTDVFNNVRAGEDTWAVDVTEAREYYLEQSKKHNYDSWDFKKRYEFTSTSGMNFELSLEQIMSLYAYSKREQAAEHLRMGGIVFDENTEVTIKNKLGIPMKFNPTEATAYNLSVETLADIVSKLTEEQKAFVDEMQTYLSDVMGEKGNEVSLVMYGVKLFKEKFYFPLKSATQFMAKAKEQQQGEVKIKNSGFSKETVQKANNPIVLTPFMDVWANHVNEMSMYHSFVLPMEDFYRVFNYKTPTSDTMATESVEMFIQNAYGKGATQYIEQLLKDLNGGAISDPRETFSKALMSKFKKAAVMSSLSVVIQQPTAMVRAMALVDAKHFGIAPITRGIVRTVIPKKHKTLWAEVKQYAPVAIIKEMGRFDTNMGRSVQDFVKAKEYKGLGKVKGFFTDSGYRDDVFSKLPALADEMAWVSIWNAVKRETVAKHKNLRPNSEEFFKVVGERFTEVVTKTQVYDSVLSRSANMRSKSAFMNMWTSFMAEPTTSINMLEDALRQGKRGNKRYAAKAIGAVYGSVILNAALVSLVYAMRDDNEDETFLEKYAARVSTEMLDGINPITYIPFLKDVWSIAQGFDIERADMSLITDLVDTLQQTVKVMSKNTGDMDEDELAEYQKEVTESLWGIADSISSLVGLPTKNVRRDINGVINLFDTLKKDVEGRETTTGSLLDEIWEDVKSSIPVVGWLPNKTKGNKLYDAIVNGDTAYVDRLKSGYKDDKAYETAVRKALRDNDPRIKEAAEARIGGDIAEYSRIVKEIKAEGFFSQDTIVASVNAEINAINKGEDTESSSDSNKAKSMYKIDDYYASIVGGDQASAYVVKEDLINTDITNGKDRDEAEDSFNSKFASYLREEYEKGNLSKSEAQRMLVNYGDKSKEEATSKVQYWAFKQEYPDYDDLSEEAVDKYYKKVKPHGISIDVYYDYSKQSSKCKGTDKDGDGKTDSGSKKAQILRVINSLPLTYAQKDALYYLNGWSAKTIYEAPWH